MSSANNAFNLKGATQNKKTGILSNIFKPKNSLFSAASGVGTLTPEQKTAGQQLISPSRVQQGSTSGVLPTQQKSSVNQQTLALQRQLNQQNAGQAGWQPLVEDGIMGPKTQAGMNFKPASSVQNTQQYQPTQQYQQPQQQERPQQAPQQNYPTYTGLISEYANMARQGSDDVQKAREALQRFQQGMAEKYAGIETQGIPLEFVQGRQGALQRAASTTEQSLQTGVQNALSAQQQQLGAIGSAAGLLAPIQAPYSNQILQFGQQGQLQSLGGGSGDIGSAVQSAVQKLTTGQMTYDQALSSLSGYGQAGVNMLQQSLPQGFNIAQSETLAKQQGQVGPALENARLSLDKLEQTMNQLVIPGQSSGLVPLNELTNWASRNLGWGKQQTAAVNGMVNEVRNALQNALSLTGTNPVEATAQSYSLLPNNPSMQNLLAAKQVLEGLGQIKQQVYGNPGLQGSNQGGGGFAEDWFNQ